MFTRLWNDETGSILSIEIILVGTVLGIGVITGLTSLRDAIITELADVGAAVSWLDQSYVYSGSTSHSSATAGTRHVDLRDYCDDGQTTTSERCLVINGGLLEGPLAGNEGGGATGP